MTVHLNAYLGELLSVVGTVDPQTIKNSEQVSDAVDMKDYEAVVAILLLGDMDNETVDFRLETDSASGFATDKTTLKAATQLAASATANDNAQIVLSARASDLPATHRYIRGRAITGGATGGPGAMIMLGVPRQGLASANDLATVQEITNP